MIWYDLLEESQCQEQQFDSRRVQAQRGPCRQQRNTHQLATFLQ